MTYGPTISGLPLPKDLLGLLQIHVIVRQFGLLEVIHRNRQPLLISLLDGHLEVVTDAAITGFCKGINKQSCVKMSQSIAEEQYF